MTKSSVQRRVDKLFSAESFTESEKIEFQSFVCELVCKGLEVKEIRDEIDRVWPTFKTLTTRQDPMNLMRNAAQNDQITYRPPFANRLAMSLAEDYNWNPANLAVVHSRSLNHVAQEAAYRLLQQIRSFKTFGNLDTVHIGFAGGRLLRLVAEKLAKLLREPSKENPSKLVFHAMVAAFSDDDFEADPNNFITYFAHDPLAVEISFIPIAAPGIVETEYRKELRKFREIREVYEAAEKLNIIISSGGDWGDKHSTTQRYLKEVDEHDVQKLSDYPAIGDLLWQPLAEDGPIDMDGGGFTFRPNTLVDLQDLPKAINDRGLRVLLALGPCGECGKPKGNLLNTIMNLDEPLVTDIVTNSPTCFEALRLKWQMPEPLPKTTK